MSYEPDRHGDPAGIEDIAAAWALFLVLLFALFAASTIEDSIANRPKAAADPIYTERSVIEPEPGSLTLIDHGRMSRLGAKPVDTKRPAKGGPSWLSFRTRVSQPK